VSSALDFTLCLLFTQFMSLLVLFLALALETEETGAVNNLVQTPNRMYVCMYIYRDINGHAHHAPNYTAGVQSCLLSGFGLRVMALALHLGLSLSLVLSFGLLGSGFGFGYRVC